MLHARRTATLLKYLYGHSTQHGLYNHCIHLIPFRLVSRQTDWLLSRSVPHRKPAIQLTQTSSNGERWHRLLTTAESVPESRENSAETPMEENNSEDTKALLNEEEEPILELDTEKTKNFAEEDQLFDLTSLRTVPADFVDFNSFIKWMQFKEAFESLGDRARLRHVVAGFVALQSIVPRPPDRFLNTLAMIAIKDIDGARSNHLCRLFYSCAKLRYINTALMQSMATKILQQRFQVEWDGAAITMTIYAIAILSRFQLLIYAAEKGMHVVDLYQLYGSETPPILFPLQPELITALCKEIASPHRLSGFREMELTNCVYGLGLLRAPESAALMALAKEISDSHRHLKFSPQEISNIVYGFGLLEHKQEPMLYAISDHLVKTRRTVELETQHLANILFGFSRMGFSYRPILAALVNELKEPERLVRFKEQELANIVSAAALVGIDDPDLYRMLGREIIRPSRLPKYIEHNFSTIVLGMANAGVRDSVVLKTLATEMCRPERLPNYTSKDICDVIIGFNNLEFMDDGFMLGLVAELRRPLRIRKTDMRVWQSCRAHVFSWSLAFPF